MGANRVAFPDLFYLLLGDKVVGCEHFIYSNNLKRESGAEWS